jgi:hypothetical protein
MVNAFFPAVDDVQVGRPQSLIPGGEFADLLDVDLYRHKVCVETFSDLTVRVRHGTQFGASASACLEKIEKQGFLRLFGKQ